MLVGYLDADGGAAGQAIDAVLELPVGGTAVGSGINTHPEFGRRVAAVLAEDGPWAEVGEAELFLQGVLDYLDKDLPGAAAALLQSEIDISSLPADGWPKDRMLRSPIPKSRRTMRVKSF